MALRLPVAATVIDQRGSANPREGTLDGCLHRTSITGWAKPDAEGYLVVGYVDDLAAFALERMMILSRFGFKINVMARPQFGQMGFEGMGHFH